MKKRKFTGAQIAFVSKQVEDDTSIAEVCRKTGIAEATFCYWRKKYGGLMPLEMKRLKMLDEENTRSSRSLAFNADRRLRESNLPKRILYTTNWSRVGRSVC